MPHTFLDGLCVSQIVLLVPVLALPPLYLVPVSAIQGRPHAPSRQTPSDAAWPSRLGMELRLYILTELSRDLAWILKLHHNYLANQVD